MFAFDSHWKFRSERLAWKTLIFFLCTTFSTRAAFSDEFNSNGVKIHYTVTGRGEPVILIHGLYSSAMMNWQMPGTINKLAQHYQVIAYDNRGHGQSGKPEKRDEYGVEMVEDVVRLMDHLNIKKAHVVGYSMGGMIAMKLLTVHPDRVSSCVLGGMGWLKAGSPLDFFWERIQPRGKRELVPTACLNGIADLGVTESQVKSVSVPVTIIVGDRDPCRRLYVAPLHQIRPDWPVETISGAGHMNCIFKREFIDALEAAL